MARHPSDTSTDHPRQLFVRAPAADAHERRNLRWCALQIVAMAGGTFAEVRLASARAGDVRREAAGPRHLVRVHVETSRLRVECRPAPFRAAVESGKHD